MAKVAFLGLGVMGYPMAGHLVAAGHEVRVWNRTGSVSEKWAGEYSGKAHDSIESAVDGADFVMMCVGRDADVIAVAGAAVPAMKPGAIFINTSRGPTYDLDALVDAVESGHLFGAGVDVFDPEPPPGDHRVFSVMNIITTPHISSGTVERQYAINRAQFANAQRVLAGHEPNDRIV